MQDTKNIELFVAYNTTTDTYTYAAHFKKSGRIVCGDSVVNFIYGGPIQSSSMSWYMNYNAFYDAGFRPHVERSLAKA